MDSGSIKKLGLGKGGLVSNLFGAIYVVIPRGNQLIISTIQRIVPQHQLSAAQLVPHDGTIVVI